mgnify:CR=1 FL=1
MSYLTHTLDAIEGHLADLISKGEGGEINKVTELSGGQISLKSYKWFQNRRKPQREFNLS